MRETANTDKKQPKGGDSDGSAGLQNMTPEKVEEVKLRSKYPQLPKAGQPSAFLQKRLQQKQKFFDSGDYNVAKSKGLKLSPFGPKGAAATALQIQQTSKLTVVNDEPSGSTSPTGSEIPTPETVPHRKSSIIAPEVASKLSPHPLHNIVHTGSHLSPPPATEAS